MTVETLYQPLIFNPGAGSLAKDIAFQYRSPAHIVVFHRTAAGVVTELVRDADYTMGGDGVAGTGTITPLADYPAEDEWIVTRATPRLQTADLVASERLPVEDIEGELDDCVLAQQERDEILSRTVRVSIGNQGFEINLASVAHGDMLFYDETTGTFVTGALTVNGDVLELRNVTSVPVGDTPPVDAQANDLWWKSDEGRMKVYYDDGDSLQWVDASPAPAPPELSAGLTDLCPVFNFTGDGEARFYAHEAMTLAVQDTSGIGTIVFENSTALDPDTFAASADPIVLEAGAWLKVSATAVTDLVAVALLRTA